MGLRSMSFQPNQEEMYGSLKAVDIMVLAAFYHSTKEDAIATSSSITSAFGISWLLLSNKVSCFCSLATSSVNGPARFASTRDTSSPRRCRT